MSKKNVIAIFDVGKTNKKLFLFDEEYNLVHEQSQTFEEIKDEDDFPCENIDLLTQWVTQKFSEILQSPDINLRAVNFSAYGASFVHLDEFDKPLTPLYNYLKPYPKKLKKQFYSTYGGESLIAKQTASPVLDSLNSGMQLYRLKYEKPEIYSRIENSLHLPQYLSFAVSSMKFSDLTSIGCHTHLWNFQENKYHKWVEAERINNKLPPVYPGDKAVSKGESNIAIGIGLHDSSAALIPYLKLFNEPFVLLSTGTWCISLNPCLAGRQAFNYPMLSDYELQNDCLCYLTYEGKPVKASRLFAGYEHEQQVKCLAEHFHKSANYYERVLYNESLLKKLQTMQPMQQLESETAIVQQSMFGKRVLHEFETYEEAYHQLMLDIIVQQTKSTKIVLNETPVKKIFVDGGFSRNAVYMNLLAAAFPNIQVFAANIPQASALGAAMAIHHYWNKNPLPSDIITLRRY